MCSTQKKTKDFLSDFFKFAVANNMANLNPVWLITLKTDKTISTEDEEEKEKIIAFNNDEIERFKEACTAKYENGVDRFQQDIFFMLNTGIRLGEKLATKYSDIDFETGVYYINKTVTAVKERDENGKSTGKKKRYIGFQRRNFKDIFSNSISSCFLFVSFNQRNKILVTTLIIRNAFLR